MEGLNKLFMPRWISQPTNQERARKKSNKWIFNAGTRGKTDVRLPICTGCFGVSFNGLIQSNQKTNIQVILFVSRVKWNINVSLYIFFGRWKLNRKFIAVEVAY